jgi:hypothetical protein
VGPLYIVGPDKFGKYLVLIKALSQG